MTKKTSPVCDVEPLSLAVGHLIISIEGRLDYAGGGVASFRLAAVIGRVWKRGSAMRRSIAFNAISVEALLDTNYVDTIRYASSSVPHQIPRGAKSK